MKALTPLALLCALFVFSLSPASAEDMHPRVRIATSLGDIVLELDAEKAPKSVENFLTYVQDGYYNGTIFHRVIDGFMAQGGGFTQDFQKKKVRSPIENEANNGLKNLNGTVAMARTNAPHSATAQFFINIADNGFLDHRSPSPRGWGYAVFGKVVEGMDVVEKIRRTPTGSGGQFRKDVPATPIIIETVVLIGDMPAAPMPTLQ
ncbi:MAG: peptidyl-prolyl cis-trans isomerase [Ectothiorhodospiraceae bacterium]|nr:peptidyl-prolyl cis-trans isomerase [Ectothiorhodospiraceae bacterium]